MGLWPIRGSENQRRRPREGGDPLSAKWTPASAGMTYMARFSAEPKAVLSETKEGSLQFVQTATAGILRCAQNDRLLEFFRSL
jgi:hypothetical protein